MSQALQIAQRALAVLEQQKMDLDRAHEAKKREIVAAGQNVSGLTMIKLLQDMNTEIARYEQDRQTLNEKIYYARTNVEIIANQKK